MGWTILYIAFGVVALWLLGEVLLQYKARLRWRLVAFCGFLGVVVGVLLPSVPVIAAGTVAFAIGQTFVTLSFRRGFSTGWALGGQPGTSRRRRPEGQGGEMRPLEPLAEDDGTDAAGYDDAYPPSPPPPPPGAPASGEEQGAYEGQAQDPYGERQDGGHTEEIYPDSPPYEPVAAPDYAGNGSYQESYGDPLGAGDPAGYPGQQAYEPAYEPVYEPAYAAYSDPYIGGAAAQEDPSAGGGGGPETYADYGAQPFQADYQPGFPGDYQQDYQQDYQPGHPAEQPYAPGYGGDYPAGGEAWPGAETAAQPAYYQETPPGGVWMPQQREPGTPDAPQPAADPYAQPDGYGGNGEQDYYADQYGQYDQLGQLGQDQRY